MLAMGGCGQASTESTPQPASQPDVQQAASTLPADAPTYLVATITSFPPFVMRDENGQSIGFDVDVLNAIGEKQGFKVKFLPQAWQTALGTLDSGERDIVATGVVITPERQALYDFSDPYLDTGWMAILKEQPDKPRFTDFKQLLNDPKLVFVTQEGAAGVPELKRLLGDKPNKIHEVETQYMEIKEVISGTADVAFDISRVLQYYAFKSGDKTLYSLMDPNAPLDHFGFVVKKGRNDLLQKINTGLSEIKADGTYQKIYEEWYGKDE